MSTGRYPRVVPALLLAGGLALAGCGDGDKSGPGTLEGTVSEFSWTGQRSGSIGAAVLTVEGTGITGISGAGDTKAFVGPENGGSRRVVLVGAGSGRLDFELDVQDVSNGATVVVQSAVDTSNEDIAALGGLEVRLRAR